LQASGAGPRSRTLRRSVLEVLAVAASPPCCVPPGPRARLIAKVFEADPLRCPCGGAIRVIAFILEPAVIRKILQDRPRPEPRAQAPPPG